MSGMNQEIASLGLERAELCHAVAESRVGGERIPYEPKELAGIVTTLRGYAPKRYLAIEGVSLGGADYITRSVGIPVMVAISPNDPMTDIKKALRDKDKEAYDLISIDARGLPLTAAEVWKYILGGKGEYAKEFGRGAPIDHGPKKWRPGTLVIFNLADPGTKDLYFSVRTMDNKMHQSKFAGMVKL